MRQRASYAGFPLALFGTAVSRARWSKLGFFLVCSAPLPLLALLRAPVALLGLLADAEAMARVVLGIPGLLLGGVVLDRRLGESLEELHRSSLLPIERGSPLGAHLRRFQSPWTLAVVTLALAALAVTLTASDDWAPILLWRGEGGRLSGAGFWYHWVSTPAYRFLWLRLCWSLCIWLLAVRLLARSVEPCPFHPDRLGGLERFVKSHTAFAPALFGLSASAAGTLGNQVLYFGRSFDELRTNFWLFVTAIDLPPLLVLLPLGPALYRARRLTLDRMAATVVGWSRLVGPYLEGGVAPTPSGARDLGAHADLIAAFDIVDRTSVVPLRKSLVLTIVGATLLPMIPVLLLDMPVGELLKRLVRLL